MNDIATKPRQRCAVYCRVSSDERLAQEFNSIDAQKEAFGGLPIETARRLANIGVENSKIKERRKPRDIHLAPGTVLMRQWGERDHRVTVSAEGTFEYEGRFFKSLSSVARHIAGTPWSGPLFFGLRRNEEVCE